MKKRRMLMKLSAVVLVILLLLTSLPVGAFAVETDVNNVNSSVVSDKITIEDVAAGAATIQDLYGEDYVVDVPDSAVAVGTATETQTATTNTEYIDDMDGATIEELLASDKRVRSKEGDDLNKIVTANDDGSYTMRLFNHPVKYINEAGKIEDISLELKTSNNGGFETKAGVSRTQFSNKISNGISLSGNGVEIELLPSMNTVSSNTKATATLAMEQATKALSVTKIDKGTVSYYYNDKTTLEYSLTYTGFKEDIVVKEYTGQTEYTFTLNTNGLTLKCENGSYYLADENGEKKATIGTIVIFTADERNNTLGSMTHEVVKENQQYILTIHVDPEWLKDEKTVYPIRIDPTMEINYAYDGADAIDDVTINSNAGSDYDNDHIYIGKRDGYGVSRVLMRFNYPFKYLVPNQKYIQRAHVEIRDIMCETTSMTVYARMFTGADWTEETASWQSVQNGVDTHSMPGVTVNYSLGNAKDPKHRYKINIMDAVKYWVSEQYDYEQGIVLRAPDSVENGTTELYKTFGSFEHSSYKPSLVITYLDHEQNCEPYGYLDAVESTNIRGWAWCIDAPNTPVRVKLYLENQTTGVTYTPITIEATIYRPDVQSAGYGTGNYGFRYDITWSNYTPGYYKVTAKALSMNGTTTEYLLNSGTKYYNNPTYTQFLNNGEYYINNDEYGKYLKNSSNTLSVQSGLLNDLGNTIKWKLQKYNGGYTISSVSNPSLYLSVSSSTSSDTVQFVSPGTNIPYECVWDLKISRGCYLRNRYNGKYLYTNSSGLYVSSSVGTYNTVTNREHTWRIVSTSSYGNTNDYEYMELATNDVFDDLAIKIGQSDTPSKHRNMSNFKYLWCDISDFNFSTTSNDKISIGGNGSVTGLVKGTEMVSVTHKVTDNSDIHFNCHVCEYVINLHCKYDTGFTVAFGTGKHDISVERITYIMEDAKRYHASKFNVYIEYDIEHYQSELDKCKEDNDDGINDECGCGENHDSYLSVINDFTSKYIISDLGKNEAYICFTGHKTTTTAYDNTNDNLSFYKDKCVYMMKDMLDTNLCHEINHFLGAPDHYHSGEDDVRCSVPLCTKCNPEAAKKYKDGCIMGENRNKDTICGGCERDIMSNLDQNF